MLMVVFGFPGITGKLNEKLKSANFQLEGLILSPFPSTGCKNTGGK